MLVETAAFTVLSLAATHLVTCQSGVWFECFESGCVNGVLGSVRFGACVMRAVAGACESPVACRHWLYPHCGLGTACAPALHSHLAHSLGSSALFCCPRCPVPVCMFNSSLLRVPRSLRAL